MVFRDSISSPSGGQPSKVADSGWEDYLLGYIDAKASLWIRVSIMPVGCSALGISCFTECLWGCSYVGMVVECDFYFLYTLCGV